MEGGPENCTGDCERAGIMAPHADDGRRRKTPERAYLVESSNLVTLYVPTL